MSSTAATSEAPRGCRLRAEQIWGISPAPVHFVSAMLGWAVLNGQILVTHNGGQRWAVQYKSTAGHEVSSIDFVDAQHGWGLGPRALLATSDGGRHWARLDTPCGSLQSVDFLSVARGYAVIIRQDTSRSNPATGGRLMLTNDGGEHWRPVTTPANVQSVCFADHRSGWLGAGGSIYATHDGGQRWRLTLAAPSRARGYPAVAVAGCSSGTTTAWAELEGPGGVASQQPHIAYHFDGHRWQPLFAEQYFPHPGVSVHAEAPGAYAGPISVISSNVAVFIDTCSPCSAPVPGHGGITYEGNSPMLIAARSGTELRRTGPVAEISFAKGASFISETNGWVVGTLNGYTSKPGTSGTRTVLRIMHTTDGGNHWTVQRQTPG